MGSQPNSSLPGVSVVIPAYNYARYLPRALDSALAQEYKNVEVIVVDDGSTDNTAEVVAAYGDRVRYIYQKNAGLPAARNTGIKAAGFEYVGFLDADDEWLPSMLARAIEAFQSLPAEYGIVASHISHIGPDNQPLAAKTIYPTEPREITCRDIILKTRFSPSAVVARRSVFDECGFFDETLRSSEDRDMWIRITAKRRAYLHGERLTLIRRHPNNMSKHADRMKANVRKVIGKAYTASLVPHSQRLFWMRVFSFYFFQNAWRFRDEGRRLDALREMIWSVLLWPCFFAPEQLNEPVCFRARALVRFLVERNPRAIA